MKLWNLLHGVPLTGEHFTEDMEISSLSYDTRTLEPGALFVALPGARTDGARFIQEALEKGARRLKIASSKKLKNREATVLK